LRIGLIPAFPLAGEWIDWRNNLLPLHVLRSDTEVVYCPVRDGGLLQDSTYETLLFDGYMAEAGLEAEAQGIDAIVIDTVSDTGVAALRSQLSIPVVAPGLAGYALAMQLGRRFSIVTEWRGWRFLNQLPLEGHYGLGGHCASVRALDIEPAVVAEFTGVLEARATIEKDPDEAFGALLAEARRAIDDDGADTIILGSLTMRPAAEYLRARLDAPVIDPGPLAFTLAEMLAELHLTHFRPAGRQRSAREAR
jgi:allantoin racemase